MCGCQISDYYKESHDRLTYCTENKSLDTIFFSQILSRIRLHWKLIMKVPICVLTVKPGLHHTDILNKSVTFNLNTKHEADFKQTADKALAKGFSRRKPYHVVGSLSQRCCSSLHHSLSLCFDKNLPSA